MDILIRPSLFNLTSSLTQIDDLLAGADLSFALFLSTNQLLLANNLFIKRWDLHRVSFPRYSLSDFGNNNAIPLSGTTKGQFWHWFSEKDPNLSLIVLPDLQSQKKRILLRIPTEKEGPGDPIFLENVTDEPSEEQKESLRLLGRRLRTPARSIVRAFSDELILDDFSRDVLARDPFPRMTEVVLAKDAAWNPDSSFWLIRQPEDARGKKVVADFPQSEGSTLVPFRRIIFSKKPGEGYWADFPLLLDGSFFGKIRLYRPESRRTELQGLKGFQKEAQNLSRLLFGVRKNLGDLEPLERDPETGFLTRKDSLRFLETLIEEHRVSKKGFGLAGLKVDLPNHREFMLKVRNILRFYDEIGHLTPREYLLILPDCNPGNFDRINKRIQDLLLGTNPDQLHLLSIGTLSFPETHKGPMNLIRSVFLREENQPILKTP